MKTLKMFVAIFSISLFVGCGGGGSSADDGNVQSLVSDDTQINSVVSSMPVVTNSVQTMAIDKIKAYANDSTQPTPSTQDYLNAGVVGVTAGNIDDVNGAVAGLSASDVDTPEKIQKIADVFLTEIQGSILNNDTTLSIENSPYKIVGNLQINRNVTLTVEPGVTIVSDGRGGFEVFGAIKINGTADNKVNLYNVVITPGENRSDETAHIEINYADISGGNLYPPTGNAAYGKLILRNSTVTNLNYYIYLWYPTADCYIENNIFNNIRDISVGISGGVKVFIRNNVFVKGSSVNNWANYTDIDNMIVQYNSFLATNEIVVSTMYDSGRMNARENFWNTTDVEKINSMIFDQNDNLSLSGPIEYSPFLSEPHYDTPVYP